MKYSQLHTKTNKSAKEFSSLNATLLIKAGFIHQEMAGVYSFLPLGLKVLNKIEKIVREEMDKIGTEILMPALSPKSNWETTGRLESVDVLFKAVGANVPSRLKNDAEYILNCTQEDIVTPLAQQFNLSYKDFPFAFYQIQNKFRNEPRAKSGLMRGREFRMKDLYSFHKTEADLLDYYNNQAKPAYVRVFDRLGLGEETVIALASGGDFTKDFSHEFQTKCESGEDLLFYDKTQNIYYNREVTPSMAPQVKYTDSEMKPREDILGEGIIGVDDLVKFLNIEIERTTKTILFKNEKGEFIASAVRGGYDIDMLKLKKITGSESLEMATPEEVKKVTGAEIGYLGIIGLPESVKVFIDESCDNRINFECGANKTNYHSININWERDIKKPEKFFDLKVANKGDLNPKTNSVYEVFKTTEVGNIFPLNTKYTKAFDYKFTDKDGSQKEIFMGSYGIGTSRIMGVLVEKFHDDKGIIWPGEVAPFQVHLVGLNLDDQEVKIKAEKVYSELMEKNIEVLFDDREDVMTGEKFNDADLIGIPWRIIISKRTEGNNVELKKRSEKEGETVSLEEGIRKIKN